MSQPAIKPLFTRRRHYQLSSYAASSPAVENFGKTGSKNGIALPVIPQVHGDFSTEVVPGSAIATLQEPLQPPTVYAMTRTSPNSRPQSHDQDYRPSFVPASERYETVSQCAAGSPGKSSFGSQNIKVSKSVVVSHNTAEHPEISGNEGKRRQSRMVQKLRRIIN